MVNKKISELTELTSADTDDVLPIVDTSEGETKKIQKNNLVPDKLTDDSMADTLHRHSELSASDGTPDAVVSVDTDGNINLGIDGGEDVIYLSRYSDAYNYVDIQAGTADENKGVGFSISYRSATGTSRPGIYLSDTGVFSVAGNTVVDEATTNYITLTDTSDADALHTHTGANLTDDVFLLNSGDISTGDISIVKNNPTLNLGDSLGGGNFGFIRWVSATDSINLGTTLGGTWNDQITLLESGNVGIGVIDPHSKLEVAGAISSATATITEDTADLDVSGINVLFVNPGAATSITGFTNGVAGQVLFISAIANGQDITMAHNSGTQKVFLHTGADETLSSEYGGWTLTCDGSNWYDTEHSKHV